VADWCWKNKPAGLYPQRNRLLTFSKSAKLGFAKPEVWNVEIPFENASNGHAFLMQNFINAILLQEALIAPGAEGIHSVELANVMLYSSLTRREVPSSRWTARLMRENSTN